VIGACARPLMWRTCSACPLLGTLPKGDSGQEQADAEKRSQRLIKGESQLTPAWTYPPPTPVHNTMTTQDPLPPRCTNRSIGNIIAKANNLSAEQVEQILQYQRNQGVRFGEPPWRSDWPRATKCCGRSASNFTIRTRLARASGLQPTWCWPESPSALRAEAVRALRSQINMRLYTGEQQRLPLAVLSAARGDGAQFTWRPTWPSPSVSSGGRTPAGGCRHAQTRVSSKSSD
jgi:hypothetical protein